MKLMFCPKCQDVLKLDYETRTCRCGVSAGKYLADGITAYITGEAIPLGFANISFVRALKNRPSFGMGRNFEAFVIPKNCSSVHKVQAWVMDNAN